jgi:imidazole glycerol-phosphate synthase subunit HisH
VKVAVVDYGSGNLASASRALAVAAERAGIAAEVSVTADPDAVARAERIVLPGQGAFADCARGLAAVPGMREAIETATQDGTPFLGICVGMQLMAERGLEHGTTDGLGWLQGEIAAMDSPGLRLPQMGWNALEFQPISCTVTPCAAAIRRRSWPVPTMAARSWRWPQSATARARSSMSKKAKRSDFVS